MLERRYSARGISFTVRIGSQPARRFKWTFATATGVTGSGITDRGRKVAFANGKIAAEDVIDAALNG